MFIAIPTLFFKFNFLLISCLFTYVARLSFVHGTIGDDIPCIKEGVAIQM